MNKQEALNKLERDLKIRRYSVQTIHRYSYIVSCFLDYKKVELVDSLTEYDVIEYLQVLTNERHYKASSYNNVNSILKFFLETTLEKNIGYRRLPNAKVEVRRKTIPERKDIIRIINNTANIKYKCFYALAYGSGLRVSEVARLKVKDIDVKNMKIRVIGKGNKERLTVLPTTTLKLLRWYCKTEGITKDDIYLFKGEKSNHITEGTISKSLKDMVKKLNMDKSITMHSLRRSFATHLLRMDTNILEVKEMMGHNSITTTSSYIIAVYDTKELKNPLDSEPHEIHS